ncbi:uncharacterized protein [Dysidea avara]|uniref:uncharacterized protein isoform X1 n=1 Tax=Dysidea avara TaxID=196820 RepID=UPI0033168C43
MPGGHKLKLSSVKSYRKKRKERLAKKTTSTVAATLPSTDPATLPSTGPATLPSTGPATLPSTGPATLPSTGPATLPSTGPATLPSTGPATLPSTGPATLPSTDPATPQSSTIAATLPSTLRTEDVAASSLRVSVPLISYTCSETKSLDELHSRLMKNGVCSGWQVVEANLNCLALAKMKLVPSPYVVASVQIYSNFNYSVTIEGHSISLAKLGAAVCSKISCISDALLLLRTIDQLHMCEGNLCSEFTEVVQHNEGKFLGTDRKTVVANIATVDGKQTIRHHECYIVVSEGTIRCSKCAAHRKSLQSAVSRLTSKAKTVPSPSSHVDTSPSSHTNLDYLTSSETSLRVRTLQGRYKASKKVISRLQEKVKQLTETQGLTVEQSLHDDLVTVMDQHESEITKQHEESSFQMLFWKQQREALKKGKGIRWHPLVIKWCLYLHHCSSKAYKVLRNSKCLHLPSERTLQDYTHFNTTGAGFSAATDNQLREYARLSATPNHKNNVGLLFDEMHIKEGLVFSKNTGNLVGFVNLGDVNNDFIRYANSEADGESSLPLAKSVLFIMVRGLTSKLTFPYAQFPVDSIKGSQLYPLFWEAVHRLECMSFKVFTCTCDGATSNRRLYHLLTKSEPEKHKVRNKYSKEERYIYLICDPPHLLKTIRNCFSSRPLWRCGKYISWQHVVSLYRRTTGAGTGVSLVPKLKYEHLHLTSFSKMRVDLAAQVLSGTVSSAMKLTGGEDARATADFIDYIDKFFDSLNVDNLNEGTRTRKKFQEPYYLKDDFRLKWLSDDFTSYMNTWKTSVEAREGYTAQQKQRNLLSELTMEGIQITVSSFVEFVPLILSQPGVTYFLSEKLCQDPLEKFFGLQRQRGKSNDNPLLNEVQKNTQALRVVGDINVKSIAGNCRGKKRDAIFTETNVQLQKRKKSRKT